MNKALLVLLLIAAAVIAGRLQLYQRRNPIHPPLCSRPSKRAAQVLSALALPQTDSEVT